MLNYVRNLQERRGMMKSEIASTVKRIIKQKGLKQKYVAGKMGITERKFSDIVNGRKTIDENVIRKLCFALEVTPNELFGYY